MADLLKIEKEIVLIHGIVIESGTIEFKKLNWVLRARSIEDNRYMMNGLHIDPDGNLVAADGRRMHIWRKCPINEYGYFRVIVTQKAIFLILGEDKFPAWEKIIPHDAPLVIERICISSPKKQGFSIEIFKLFQDTKACFNLNYITDIGSYAADSEWSVYGEDPNGAWLFQHEDLEAIVMPMYVRPNP